jgi:hypothetical protein
MLKKTLAAVMLAAFAGSAGLEYASLPAAAATAAGNLPLAITSDSSVQYVAWVYAPRKHGPRYRYKRPGFVYFYNGYYYSRPWWTIGIGPAPVPGAFVYVPGKYGPRYKIRRPGYGYYYGGYWYRRPWWRPGVNLCIGC